MESIIQKLTVWYDEGDDTTRLQSSESGVPHLFGEFCQKAGRQMRDKNVVCPPEGRLCLLASQRWQDVTQG